MVKKGKRYRMVFHNQTGDTHPLHLHRHDFEIVKIGGKTTAGIKKDIVNIPRFSDAEVDFVADHPGPSSLPLPHAAAHGFRIHGAGEVRLEGSLTGGSFSSWRAMQRANSQIEFARRFAD